MLAVLELLFETTSRRISGSINGFENPVNAFPGLKYHFEMDVLKSLPA